MKKILFFALLAFALYSAQATSSSTSAITTTTYEYSNDTCYPYGKYGKQYPKGNISPKELPATTLKYLDENYPDHDIIVCKRKGNGNYFVKIRFGENQYRPYYRSLVFDSRGSVIKG